MSSRLSDPDSTSDGDKHDWYSSRSNNTVPAFCQDISQLSPVPTTLRLEAAIKTRRVLTQKPQCKYKHSISPPGPSMHPSQQPHYNYTAHPQAIDKSDNGK